MLWPTNPCLLQSLLSPDSTSGLTGLAGGPAGSPRLPALLALIFIHTHTLHAAIVKYMLHHIPRLPVGWHWGNWHVLCLCKLGGHIAHSRG